MGIKNTFNSCEGKKDPKEAGISPHSSLNPARSDNTLDPSPASISKQLVSMRFTADASCLLLFSLDRGDCSLYF